MADSSPTVGELFKAKAVTDDEVNAAVEVFMKDAEAGAHPIAAGYSLDLAAAVGAHLWASKVIVHPESSPGLKRAAVRTAILLARAQKG